MASDPKRVAYFYDSEVGNFYYGQAHPMKPHRIRMTHSLLINYGLYEKMEIFRPHRADMNEITRFHSDDYAEFLRTITPDNMSECVKQLHMFNVGEDCPVFDGIYDFCQLSAGGSIDGAVRLNHGECDVAVNWAGGLHHAKKSEASGFCYVNDIVLSILELLKYHHRVLYVDIDVHHGDGVEEAFYSTNRVMTLSFHKYGDFFPGTGDVRDIGVDEGKYYALNFPLNDGLDDESFEFIFKPLMSEIMATYQPNAVVLQAGADSLTGDRLGCFNLSLNGHAMPMAFLKQFNVPVLLLGGGGYTIRNVARAWANETAVALGESLDNDLPYNDYVEYYAPDYKLHFPCTNMTNHNSREYLSKHLNTLLDHLRHVQPPGAAPVQRPPDAITRDVDDDNDDPDVREPTRLVDQRVDHRAELAVERNRTHADVELRPDDSNSSNNNNNDSAATAAQAGGTRLQPVRPGDARFDNDAAVLAATIRTDDDNNDNNNDNNNNNNNNNNDNTTSTAAMNDDSGNTANNASEAVSAVAAAPSDAEPTETTDDMAVDAQ